MNCSSKRSGKHILAQLEEATQSHQVIGSKSATSMFQGAMKSPTEQVTNKIPSSSPLAAFLKPVIKPQEEKKERKSKNKSGKHSKNVKEKKPEPVEQAKSFPAENPTASNSRLSIKAASLILFEEVSESPRTRLFESGHWFYFLINCFRLSFLVYVTGFPCIVTTIFCTNRKFCSYIKNIKLNLKFHI